MSLYGAVVGDHPRQLRSRCRPRRRDDGRAQRERLAAIVAFMVRSRPDAEFDNLAQNRAGFSPRRRPKRTGRRRSRRLGARDRAVGAFGDHCRALAIAASASRNCPPSERFRCGLEMPSPSSAYLSNLDRDARVPVARWDAADPRAPTPDPQYLILRALLAVDPLLPPFRRRILRAYGSGLRLMAAPACAVCDALGRAVLTSPCQEFGYSPRCT